MTKDNRSKTMKYLSKIIILFLITAFGFQSVSAQNSVDANRMNRDINIMENILQELFRTRWEARGNRVSVAPAGNFLFGGGKDIRGTYLPGYGVIFMIPGGPPGFVTYSDTEDGKSFSYSFQYSSGDAENEVNEESITRRIKEFLRDYGSTIGQLANDDRVMVIYNTRHRDRGVSFFSSSGEDKDIERLPTISVVAQKSDLQGYRFGNLNADQLDNRISVSTVEEDAKELLDLKVMANIFETALKEQDEKSFRISGSVNYLNLDNFGALFFFDARYSSSARGFLLRPGGARVFSLSGDAEQKARIEVENAIEAKLKETKEQQQELAEEMKKSYDTFISNIKEYLVDYGRTLSSVGSDQYIMISATISTSLDDIPERVDIQVRKSVLTSMDRGQVSRDEALSQVVVREY